MGDYLIYVQKMWVGTYSAHLKSYILVFHIENVALQNLIFSSFETKSIFLHIQISRKGEVSQDTPTHTFSSIYLLYITQTQQL